MSILVNASTRLIVQGITGTQGRLHTRKMQEYGTNIVAGVTPGKGDTSIFGIPVYETVQEAAAITGADASIIFVPPAYAADSILEATDAALGLIVCITEGIPVIDMIRVKRYLAGKKTRLIGPNCPGIITPGSCKVGIMPDSVHQKGRVGVISRSGTLTYEAVDQLTRQGIGQSTAIGIGGDPVGGLDFIDVLQLFQADPDTDAVVMIGEIGGTGEQKAASWIRQNMTKPVVAFIAGLSAPPGRRMGHAGAIIAGGSNTAGDKIKVLRENGIRIAASLDRIGDVLTETLKETGLYQRCRTTKFQGE